MMSMNVIISIGVTILGIVYLIATKQNHHMNNCRDDCSKSSGYDEELNILDSILYRAKLKNEGKSMDNILENLSKQNIQFDFRINIGEKNERL